MAKLQHPNTFLFQIICFKTALLTPECSLESERGGVDTGELVIALQVTVVQLFNIICNNKGHVRCDGHTEEHGSTACTKANH